MHRRLALLTIAFPAPLLAQLPDSLVRPFHDRAAAVIREMSSRPLTPGDTMLTWNPQPGGLIHTVLLTPSTVETSLLRGDGMIGTATSTWSKNRVRSFRAEWTTRDSVTRQARPDQTAEGEVVGSELVVKGTKPGRYPLPSSVWGVADFGMEDQLLPLLISPQSVGTARILVYRPWHARWDTVSVTSRDTLSYRVIDWREGPKTHETVVVTRDRRVLWAWRHDQDGERRPLEGSAEYSVYLTAVPFLRSLATRDPTRTPSVR